jgi:hypothetical protein
MRSLACVLFLAACTSGGDTDFPITPGTGSGGSSGLGAVDAGAIGDGNVLVRGRVCVIDNVVVADCAATNAQNLLVTLGDQTAITAADGSFAINAPTTSGLSFTVSGPGVVTTQQALNARAQINALRQTAFDQMLVVNDVVPVTGAGSIIATVTRGGVPVSGVTAASTPAAAFGPFFAGTGPDPWTLNSTGVSGIVWFPGIMAGPADLSFNTLTGGEAIVGGVQVVNGGITMVETPLP